MNNPQIAATSPPKQSTKEATPIPKGSHNTEGPSLSVAGQTPESPEPTSQPDSLTATKADSSAGPFNPLSSPTNSKHSVGRKAGKGKKKPRKKKGKTGPRLTAWGRALVAGHDQALATQAIVLGNHAETQSQEATSPVASPQAGGGGVAAIAAMECGLHSPSSKIVGEKEPAADSPIEDEPVDVEQDKKVVEPIEKLVKAIREEDGEEKEEEVWTRARAWAEQKAKWEASGEVMVRVYARPLNPRLIMVEVEGEDGVERHGRIVVNERQRGMFGPGKLVWVRGPLVGVKWELAGKYNFVGNRVA